jgi:hypothetical protein
MVLRITIVKFPAERKCFTGAVLCLLGTSYLSLGWETGMDTTAKCDLLVCNQQIDDVQVPDVLNDEISAG